MCVWAHLDPSVVVPALPEECQRASHLVHAGDHVAGPAATPSPQQAWPGRKHTWGDLSLLHTETSTYGLLELANGVNLCDAKIRQEYVNLVVNLPPT